MSRRPDGATDMIEDRRGDDAVRADTDISADAPPVQIRYSGLSTVLRIDAGVSILQIGAADGALTAALASPGASVLALEADTESARQAGARSVHIDTARVIDTTLAAWLEGDDTERPTFDVIVHLEPRPGVETATASLDEVLAATAGLLRPSGTLVVAARSPWGLSGLLRPSGPGPGRAATALARDLTRHGLHRQRWLLPYPDHLQPQVIVDTTLFEEAEGRAIIKAAVREPVPPADSRPYLVSPSTAFGDAVDAGLAAAIADSYIVLAARGRQALDHVAREGLLWTVPAAGLAPAWQRPRELLDVAGRRLWHALDTYRPQVSGPLLLESATIPAMPGRSGEDLVVEALTGPGAYSPASRDVLRTWWAAAAAAIATSEPRRRPLDVRPRHFVVSDDGAWHYQAQDLRLRFALPLETLAFAALADTVGEAVLRSGWLVGLPPDATVAEAARAMLADIGVDSDVAREYLWVETAADIIVRTSEGTDRDEARRVIQAGLEARLDSQMRSIPIQGLLEAGTRFPALSARVAELEREGGAAKMETPEAPDSASGVTPSAREDDALRQLEALSGSEDAYQLARQQAQPWMSVAGIVCEREGLPLGGPLQPVGSGSRPAVRVPPGHVIKFYGPWDWGDILYDQEVLALRRLDGDATLPVSRLVAAGRLSESWRYAVISWLDGARLKDIDERLWTGDAADLMAWLGRFVRALHALPLDPDEQATGLAQHRKVVAYRHREAARRAGQRNLLPRRLLEQIDTWLPPLNELLETAAGTVVVHADLTPSNVIGEAGASGFRPTRIIDFNQCVVAYAPYELGPVWWTIAEGHPERTRTFLAEAQLPGMTEAPDPRHALAWAILNPAWRPGPFAWLDSVDTLEELADRAFGDHEA